MEINQQQDNNFPPQISRISKKNSSQQQKSQRGFINLCIMELVPFIIIIAYSYFCQSFYTPLTFVLGLTIINNLIEKYYGKIESIPDNQISLSSNFNHQNQVKRINLQRIIWAIMIIFQNSILVFKLVYIIIFYASPNKVQWDSNILDGLELYVNYQDNGVKEYFKMLTPSVVLGFYSIFAFTQIKKINPITFEEIIQNPPKKTKLLTAEIIVCFSLVSVQIFQVSLFSYVFLIFQILNLIAFVFKDGKRIQIGSTQKVMLSQTHIKIVKILMLLCKYIGYLYFALNYLFATQYFLSIEPSKYNYQWMGLNNVEDFIKNWEISPWQLLSNLILIFLCFWVLDIIKYRQISQKIKRIIENDRQQLNQALDHQHVKEEKSQFSDDDDEESIYGIQREGTKLQGDKIGSQNQEPAQIKSLSQSQSSFKSSYERPLDQDQIELFQKEGDNEQNKELKKKEQKKQKQLHTKAYKVMKKSVKKAKKVGKSIARGTCIYFKKFISMFNSYLFTTRILQAGCIITISRYNNYYSLLQIIFMAITGFTLDGRILRASSVALNLPALLATYITMIWANFGDQIDDVSDMNNYLGFKTYKHFWEESLIINGVIFLNVFFIRQVEQHIQAKNLKVKRKKEGMKSKGKKNEKKKSNEVGWMTIIGAFLLKISFIAALFILWWISLSAVNLINLVLVILLLVFFSNITTTVIVKYFDKKKNEEKEREVTFNRKYWWIIKVFLDIVIFARYFYYLQFNDNIDDTDSKIYQIINFIGLNYDYKFNFPYSLNSQDFADESIFWTLYIFVILQSDAFKSQIYYKYSHKIIDIIACKKIVIKCFPSLRQFCKWFEVFFFTLLVWLTFSIIVCIYMYVRFNLINTVLLFMTFWMIVYYVISSKNEGKLNYLKFRRMLFTLILVQVFVLLIRYICQFTSNAYIKNFVIDPDSSGYKFFEKYRQLIGLYNEVTEGELRELFIPGMTILFFGIITLDHISFLSNGFLQNQNLGDQEKKMLESRTMSRISRMSSVSGSSFQEYIDFENLQEKQQLEYYESFKNFVQTEITEELKWMKPICKFVSVIITHVNTLLVLIFAMYFRTAVSMFILLSIYLYYYYKTNSETFKLIVREKVYEKLSTRIKQFKQRYVLFEAVPEQLTEADKLNKKTLREYQRNETKMKLDINLNVWTLSFYFTLFCAFFSYCSQFLCSIFMVEKFNSFSILLQQILFILGIQVVALDEDIKPEDMKTLEYISDPSAKYVVDQTWFYVMIFWLTILELRGIQFLKEQIQKEEDKELEQDISFSQSQSHSISVDIKEGGRIQEQGLDLQKKQSKSASSAKKIKPKKEEGIILEEDSQEEDEDEDEDDDYYLEKQLGDEQQKKLFQVSGVESDLSYQKFQIEGFQSKNLINDEFIDVQKAHKLVLYFKSKLRYMNTTLLLSLVVFIQRICVMLILINSDVSSNIFSWVYMGLGLYFWVISNNPHSIRTMNVSSILVVLLQYSLLLLNINSDTAQIPMPAYLYDNTSLSLIEHLTSTGGENDWLQFFGFQSSNNQVTFVVNALIVFFIAMFFSIFNFLARKIVSKTQNLNLVKNLKVRFWLNFQNWRSGSFVIMNGIYEGMLVYGHVVLLLLLIIASTYNYSIFNLLILISSLGMLFYLEMILPYPFKQDHIIYLLKYLKGLKIYLFGLLFIVALYKIPFINEEFSKQFKDDSFLAQQIIHFDIIDKIIMLFMITVLNDILEANDYGYVVNKNAESAQITGKMIAKCMVFEKNDQKIDNLIKEIKSQVILKREVQEASEILNKWHKQVEGVQAKKMQQQQEKQQVNSQSQLNAKTSQANMNNSQSELSQINVDDQNQQYESEDDEYLAYKKQKEDQENKKTEKKKDKTKIQLEVEEYHKKNQMNAFRKTVKKVKYWLKSFLVMSINFCDNHKNKYLFLDEANLLNKYLEFNDQFLDCYLFEIEDLVNENSTYTKNVLEFIENFYKYLFEKIRENSNNLIFNDMNIKEEMIKQDKYNDQDVKVLLENEMEAIGLSYGKQSETLKKVKIVDSQRIIRLYNLIHKINKEVRTNSANGLFEKFLTSFCQLLISQWTIIVFIFFVLYYLYNQGLVSMILPIMLFSYFILIEGIANYTLWNISFFYSSFLIVFKFSLCLNGIDYLSETSVFQSFFSGGQSLKYEGVIFAILFVQVAILKRMGCYYQNYTQLESTHQGYIRNIINKKISFEKSNLLLNSYFSEKIQPQESIIYENSEKNKSDNIFQENFKEQSDHAVNQIIDDKLTQNKEIKSDVDENIPEEIEEFKQFNEQTGKLELQQNKVDTSMRINEPESVVRKRPLSQQANNQPKKSYFEKSSALSKISNQSSKLEKKKSRSQMTRQELIEKRLSSKEIIKVEFEEDIKSNPDLLKYDRNFGLFYAFTDVYIKKVGIDLYPLTVTVQILALIYVLLFYSKMDTSLGTSDLEGSVSTNSFPGQQVIVLLIQVVFIVFERYITLKQNVIVPTEKKQQEETQLETIKEEDENLSSRHNSDFNKAQDEEQSEIHEKKHKSQQSIISHSSSNSSQGDKFEEKDSEKELTELGELESQEESQEEFQRFKYVGITKEWLKFILLIVTMIFVFYFVFFHCPEPFSIDTSYNSSSVYILNQTGVYYQTTGYLIFFFLIYCVYFLLSGIQIRKGYKKYKRRDTLYQYENLPANILIKTINGVPFIQEIKIVMDWTFTKTSLDLFQWFKLQDMQYYLYYSKMESKDRMKRKPGQPVDKILKIAMGTCQTILLLLLVFGPLLIFSNLNPVTEPNQIVSGDLSVSLLILDLKNPGKQNEQIIGTNQYSLYSTGHINDLKNVNRSNKDGEVWSENEYGKIPLLKNSQDQQFQQFNYAPYSDDQWTLSYPAIKYIKQQITKYLNGKEDSSTGIGFQLVVDYAFQREQSQIASVPKSYNYPEDVANGELGTYLNRDQVLILQEMLNECKSEHLYLKQFYIDTLVMYTDKDTTKPHLLMAKQSANDELMYQQNVSLNLRCINPQPNKDGEIIIPDGEDPSTQKYWTLSIGESLTDNTLDLQGLPFYVYTDMYSKAAFGFSLITIYTSVILIIGTYIKGFYSGQIQLLIYMEIPKPDKFLKICHAIQIARIENDLIQENLFYYELVDILRSPEILKLLGESWAIKQKKRLDDEHPQKIKTE